MKECITVRLESGVNAIISVLPKDTVTVVLEVLELVTLLLRGGYRIHHVCVSSLFFGQQGGTVSQRPIMVSSNCVT